MTLLSPESRERPVIRAKDRKWLRMICDWTSRQVGMYPGISCKLIPYGPAERLRRLGLVDTYEPHNPIHDTRYVATDAASDDRPVSVPPSGGKA